MAAVAVVGGGITGLTAAYLLQKEKHDVIVLEAEPRLGGKIRSVRFHDVTIEAGADAFLPRDGLPLELAREVGLGDALIEPAVFGAYVWHKGALQRLPPGFTYGLPRSPVAAWRAGLLSIYGVGRVLFEGVAGRPLRGPDVSIGNFIRARFGTEVLDNLVDPLLAGTRAGDPDRISLAAGAREIDAIARKNSSVSRALARTSREIGAGSPAFVSLAGGLERLCDAISDALDQIRLNTPVLAIQRNGSGYRLITSDSDVDVERVVITVPAYSAGRLFEELDAGIVSQLEAIDYASSALIALAYPNGSFEPPSDGSGVLVPSREQRLVTGITWYSSKWPASAPPDGSLIFRCFVGRATEDDALALNDEDLTEAVVADVRDILSIDAEPLDRAVFHWDRAMPIYEVGHLERIAAIRGRLPSKIALAGAAYDGTGIPDCMRSGAEAATLISGA